MKTCGQCQHYLAYHQENNGQCYWLPPVPQKDGSAIRPTLKANTHACAQIKELPPEAQPEVKIKASVPSHGLVMKKDKPKPSKQPAPATVAEMAPQPQSPA